MPAEFGEGESSTARPGEGQLLTDIHIKEVRVLRLWPGDYMQSAKGERKGDSGADGLILDPDFATMRLD